MTAASESIRVEGLAEFRKGLRHAADPKEAKAAVRRADLIIAKELLPLAKGYASAYRSSTAHFARWIRAGADTRGAWLAGPKEGNAAIWGTNWYTHSGWYAKPWFVGDSPQHPPWVGNAWDVGGRGGPRGINDAIRVKKDRIVRHYGEVIPFLTKNQFNDAGPRRAF